MIWRTRFVSSVAWPAMMYRHPPMTPLAFQRIMTMAAKALGLEVDK